MKNKEILRVYCFRDMRADFAEMRTGMQSALRHAFDAAEKAGYSPPIALLANETGLRYKFDIKEKEVISIVAQLQKLLPKDIWAAIGFNVYQVNGAPANMGYFFTQDGMLHQPKRVCMSGDRRILYSAGFDESKWEKKWDAEGAEMSKKGVPFPELAAPGGFNLEYRICADAQAKPRRNNQNMVTLVSASEIQYPQMRKLSQMRMKIVANDSHRIGPYVLSSEINDMYTINTLALTNTAIVSIY